MFKKTIALFCVVCIISAVAFSATAVYGSGGADLKTKIDEIIEFSVKNAGTSGVNDYIGDHLAVNAGTLSEWMSITLARYGAGYDMSAYTKKLDVYVKNNNVPSASKRLLYSLAFLSCGDEDNPYISSSVNDSIGELGIMSYIYGLHMLNNGYVSDKFTVNEVISILLSQRVEDGGWALFGTVSDVDVSSMTVQALSPYYNSDKDVKKAVDEALALLSKRQLDDGAYSGFGKENCESTAQVAIAMASLGIDYKTDGRFIKNGNTVFDGIEVFSLGNGSYSHINDGNYNYMGTVQALMAYVAYYRMLNGKTPFYTVKKVNKTETTHPVTTTAAAESALTAATTGYTAATSVSSSAASSDSETTARTTITPTETTGLSVTSSAAATSSAFSESAVTEQTSVPAENITVTTAPDTTAETTTAETTGDETAESKDDEYSSTAAETGITTESLADETHSDSAETSEEDDDLTNTSLPSSDSAVAESASVSEESGSSEKNVPSAVFVCIIAIVSVVAFAAVCVMIYKKEVKANKKR